MKINILLELYIVKIKKRERVDCFRVIFPWRYRRVKNVLGDSSVGRVHIRYKERDDAVI